MEAIIFPIIQQLSLLIGIIGILIILIGAMKGLYQFCKQRSENLQMIRMTLGSHTILGLDFLVGKDIMDTLAIDPGAGSQQFYLHLIGLFSVVTIRIILTYFTSKELKAIECQKKT